MEQKMLTQVELSTFCGGVAAMLRSGFSSESAVALFAEDTPGGAGKAARAMCSAMESGEAFASAAEETGMFPGYALDVFHTAELSGRLDEALDRLSVYYQRQHALMERLRNTLSYPVVLLLMMCGVLAVLVFQVLPIFERVYGDLTGSIAASAYAYVLFSAAISRISLIVACLVGGALLLLALLLRFPNGREKLRKPMETSFLTRKASWLLAVSGLTDSLTTLLSSGMDPEGALELSLGMTRHGKLKTVLEGCLEKQRQGQTLAQALYGAVLPGLYGRMLLGGAQSGRMEAVLAELSERLERDAEAMLGRLIDKVEPILIGFLTVSVGLTLISVMLPLLEILGAV